MTRCPILRHLTKIRPRIRQWGQTVSLPTTRAVTSVGFSPQVPPGARLPPGSRPPGRRPRRAEVSGHFRDFRGGPAGNSFDWGDSTARPIANDRWQNGMQRRQWRCCETWFGVLFREQGIGASAAPLPGRPSGLTPLVTAAAPWTSDAPRNSMTEQEFSSRRKILGKAGINPQASLADATAHLSRRRPAGVYTSGRGETVPPAAALRRCFSIAHRAGYGACRL